MVQIWQYMQEFSGIKLLMGDLNAEPHSNTIRSVANAVCHQINDNQHKQVSAG